MDLDETLPGRVRLIGRKAAGQALVGLVEHVGPDGETETKRYGWPIALQDKPDELRATIRALHRQWLDGRAAQGQAADDPLPAIDVLMGQDL